MTILSTLEVLHMTSVFHVFKTTEHNLCPSKFISFIEQSYTIHWFVFDWVRMPNSIKNNPMDFVLICFIEFDWFGNWTRTQFGVRFGSMTKLMYRSIPKPPIPPQQTPGHLTFLKNFGQILRYVASLDGQKPHPFELQRGSNFSPSRHVKATVETSSAKFSFTTNSLFSLSSLHTLNKGIFHNITI